MEQLFGPTQIAFIVAVVFALHALLYGLHAALGFIKDKTETQADNKVYDFLGFIVGLLQKLVEVLGAMKVEKKEEAK